MAEPLVAITVQMRLDLMRPHPACLVTCAKTGPCLAVKIADADRWIYILVCMNARKSEERSLSPRTPRYPGFPESADGMRHELHA